MCLCGAMKYIGRPVFVLFRRVFFVLEGLEKAINGDGSSTYINTWIYSRASFAFADRALIIKWNWGVYLVNLTVYLLLSAR